MGAGVVHAKPKVAVLGLEVIDNGAIDEQTTDVAQLLTTALRREATKPDGKFELAPNSAKNLLELKLLSDCSDEGRGCMSAIGRDLGADHLIYGKLERRDDGYQVSLRLLDTRSEEMEKSTSELIPADEATEDSAGSWARTLYGHLTGAPTSGTLVIESNADRGTVYVDGQVTTTLSDGKAKVLGLDEGTHTIVVDAPGYRRYEADVAISAGDTETLSLSLRADGGGGDEVDEPGKGWRIAFLGGVLVTGGLTAGWVYNGVRVRGSLRDDKDAAWGQLQAADQAFESADVMSDIATFSKDAMQVGQGEVSLGDACDAARSYRDTDPTLDSPTQSALSGYISRCKDGERAALLTNVFIGASVASALATAYFGYKGWFGHGSESREGRKERDGSPTVRFSPSITPSGVGAGLAIEF